MAKKKLQKYTFKIEDLRKSPPEIIDISVIAESEDNAWDKFPKALQEVGISLFDKWRYTQIFNISDIDMEGK